MAKTSATISVGADTRQLERDIQSALARDFKFKGFSEKAFTQPLGRITGAANEFQKSLDASNARVIAFGASAGLIYSVEKAFTSLVKSTIDVQKSLTDINVILNTNSSNLQRFGNSLFDIAKNTAQSFDTVAQAATEFARQGLTLEETLKRTKDALILTRLSGLDTISSVEALTATLNSFNKAGLDSTAVINKLANVDAAFAVSSGDLAEAIKRVGSSATDAGVSFDQLLAIVTSVQQTTARGGAVIGNSLKTIFTRLERTSVLDQLERLGIQVRDTEDNTLPAIQILSNLAKTYDSLGDAQKSQTAELVGGVFQINILKAALGDLNKQYSVYKNALDTAGSSTDEAIIRNEKLNQTLSALVNKTFVNLTKVGSEVGNITLAPTLTNTLNLLNKGLESLSTDSNSTGGKIAKGVLEGLGSFISGPGVVLVTAVFGKLFLNLAKFASQSIQTLLNINTQADQRAQIQTKINQILAQEPNLISAIYNRQISVLDVENNILQIIRQQTLERERAAAVSAAVTEGLLVRGVSTKGGTLKAKSGGFIPNFSASEIYGALAGGYVPGSVRQMNIPGQGNITYNTAETVKNFPGMSQPAIMPPQGSAAGKNYQKEFIGAHGFNPYASGGFIPNFADYMIGNRRFSASQIPYAIKSKVITSEEARAAGYLNTAEKNLLKEKEKSGSYLIPPIFSNSPLLALNRYERKQGYTFNTPKGNVDVNFPVIPFNQNSAGFKLTDLRKNLDKVIDSSIENFATSIYKTRQLNPPIDLPKTIEQAKHESEGLAGSVEGTIGGIFESAFRSAFGRSVKAGLGGGFDVGRIPRDLGLFFPGAMPGVPGDFKSSDSGGNRKSMALKILRSEGMVSVLNLIGGKNAAAGFIPNFTALDSAIGREVAAGTSISRIRIGKDSRLTSSANPLGLGVYNTKDEPMGLGQGVQRYGSKAKMAGAANGFIPNFANSNWGFSEYIRPDDPLVTQMKANTAAMAENARQQKIATQSIESLSKSANKANKNLSMTGDKFLLLSALAPILLSTVSQFSPNNKGLQRGVNAAQTALAFAGTGAFIGSAAPGIGTAIGAGAGLAIGGVLAAYQYLEDIKSEDFKNKMVEYEKLKDEFNSTQNAVQQLLPTIEEYKNVQISNVDEITKKARLDLLRDKIIEVTSQLPEEIGTKIIEGFNAGELDKIPDLINQGLFGKSAELIEKEAVTFLEGLKLEGQKPGDTEKIAKILTGGINPATGRGFVSQFLETKGGREKASEIVDQLAALRRGQTISIGGVQVGGGGGPIIEKNIFGTQQLTKGGAAKLSAIFSALDPIYSSTVEGQKYFEDIKNEAKNIALSTGDENKVLDFIINNLQKRLALSQQALKLEEINVVDAKSFAASFAKGQLTREKINKYLEQQAKLEENQPAYMIGAEFENLLTSVDKEVLNFESRDKIQKDLINGQKDLANQYLKGKIDYDEYLGALKSLKESSILLDKRQRGQLFAEDFRTGRQTQRESRILNKQTKIGDFSQAFFDEFDNRSEDSYRQAQLGAADTARTIKSEFNNAFLSFANGTATASDAFTKMALNISDKIQQLALEFSTNLIFGKLFGSTSNIFGGGGGGLFGSLFGKSQGGLIKGYSTGGHVFGGSGSKDDVPAMLSQGEYVVRKNAVKKYGLEYLQMLNEGKVDKKFAGGAAALLVAGLSQAIKTNPTNNSPFTGVASLMISNKNKNNKFLKYGGIIQGFAEGGFANFLGNAISSTGASNLIGNTVSTLNNKKAYADYAIAQNNASGLKGWGKTLNLWTNLIQGGRTNWQIPSSESSYGSTSSFLRPRMFNDGQEFNFGGRVQKFADGGESKFLGENVYRYNDPLNPTGGQNIIDPRLSLQAILDQNNPQNRIRQERERVLYDYLNYVAGVNESNRRSLEENIRVNQEIQNQYNTQKSAKSRGAYMSFGLGLASAGLGFLAKGGEVKKFASGGSSEDDVPALLMGGEFVMKKEAVNMYGKKFFDDLNAGRAKKFADGGAVGNVVDGTGSTNYSPTSNVNVTINLNQENVISEKSETNTSANNQEEANRTKMLAEQVKTQVMRVITEQQRPGGLLSSSVYSKKR